MTKTRSAIAALIGAAALTLAPLAVTIAAAQEPPSAPAPSDAGGTGASAPSDAGSGDKMSKKSSMSKSSKSMKKKKKPSHHKKAM